MTIQKSLSNGESYGFGTVSGKSTTLIASNQTGSTMTGSYTWSNKTQEFSLPPKKQITLLSAARGNGEPIFVKNTVPTTEPRGTILFTFTQGQ
ncbi:hypothetical protein JKA73_15620 [Myxococcus xanthus]|uniref:hypothetical protein n=1 Tax=Myxococcus xanthus TaxID=34 RepID=UPI0019172807|nr:hypothetical protein [Myxococcus xanthus]QQR47395.1 hypothetical protein JKA73_15620 [Myxococcus xanthus]